MDTESRRNLHNVETPTVAETRANVIAETDEEREALAKKKHINPRIATLTLAGVVALGVGGGVIAAENIASSSVSAEQGGDQGTKSAEASHSASTGPSPSNIDTLKSAPATAEAGGQSLDDYRASLKIEGITLVNGQPSEADVQKVKEKLRFKPALTTNGHLLETEAGVLSATDLLSHDETTLANAANVNQNDLAVLKAMEIAFAETHVNGYNRIFNVESGFAKQIIEIGAKKLSSAEYIKATTSENGSPTLIGNLGPLQKDGANETISLRLTIGFDKLSSIPTNESYKQTVGADADSKHISIVSKQVADTPNYQIQVTDPSVL